MESWNLKAILSVDDFDKQNIWNLNNIYNIIIHLPTEILSYFLDDKIKKSDSFMDRADVMISLKTVGIKRVYRHSRTNFH